MELEAIELDKFHEAGGIVGDEVVGVVSGLFLQAHQADVLQSRRVVLLEKAGFSRTVRTADDRQRAPATSGSRWSITAR
jgi:hypothetical protein